MAAVGDKDYLRALRCQTLQPSENLIVVYPLGGFRPFIPHQRKNELLILSVRFAAGYPLVFLHAMPRERDDNQVAGPGILNERLHGGSEGCPRHRSVQKKGDVLNAHAPQGRFYVLGVGSGSAKLVPFR